MSKSNRIIGLLLLLAFSAGACYVVWLLQKHPRRTEMVDSKPENGNLSPVREDISKTQSRQVVTKMENVTETLKAIEQFDIELNDLRKKSGEDWVAGLKIITEDVNRLSKRSDFEGFTAAALMIKRISALTIGRLMSGEVAANPTNDALGAIIYQIPTDQELFEFIGQYYSDPGQEQKGEEPASVLEYASRFEPELVFPDDQWIRSKTMSGMISGRNATLSLLSIAWAKPQLELARVTALYLARGGDRNLRGKELEADLEMRVGKEIALVTPPKFASAFGNMNPTAADISDAIGDAMREFERNSITPK